MGTTLRDKIYLRFIVFKIFILLVPFGDAFSQSPDTTVYGMKNIDSKIELFCTDPLRSIEFYRKLGFKLLVQKEDLYTTMKRNDFIIAISPVKKSKSLSSKKRFKLPPYGVEIVLYTDGLKELKDELTQQGQTPTAIELQPWGLHDFRLTDPDGYYVRISEHPKE